MEFYIVLYSHRHGADAWPVSTDTTVDQVISGLDDWEPERGETIELLGPFSREDFKPTHAHV